MNEFAKLVAAIGVAFEHIKRGGSGGEKNDIAVAGRGVGELDGLRQRIRAYMASWAVLLLLWVTLVIRIAS